MDDDTWSDLDANEYNKPRKRRMLSEDDEDDINEWIEFAPCFGYTDPCLTQWLEALHADLLAGTGVEHCKAVADAQRLAFPEKVRVRARADLDQKMDALKVEMCAREEDADDKQAVCGLLHALHMDVLTRLP